MLFIPTNHHLRGKYATESMSLIIAIGKAIEEREMPAANGNISISDEGKMFKSQGDTCGLILTNERLLMNI